MSKKKKVFSPIAVVEVELGKPLTDLPCPGKYREALVLARLHGEPLATVRVPLVQGTLRADDLRREFMREDGSAFARPIARQALLAGEPPRVIDFSEPPVELLERHPLVTVAVCTRDRTEALVRCLDALLRLDYPNLDLLVVDNAPRSDSTEVLIRERYPTVRHVREPRPGLDWARNRAVLEARGEIVAFTDDDVVVDEQWVRALVRVFDADETVMAVTGLVVPYELETPAQQMFETYGGFGRGFRRRWFKAPEGRPAALAFGGAGAYGTGANMAYRRRLFDVIGGFDPSLDVGTCTNGGGDLEMFFRVLKEGHVLVYEPSAIVRHRHRPTDDALEHQIANNGVGFYSYLVRTAIAYPDEREAVLRLGFWWFRWWSVRRLVRGLIGRERVPLRLIVGELIGSVRGLFRYQRSRRQAARLMASHRAEPVLRAAQPSRVPRAKRNGEAIRRIDLSEPIRPITDAEAYRFVRVYVFWRGVPIGHVIIEHDGAPVSPLRIQDAIVDRLAELWIDARARLGQGRFWPMFLSAISARLSGQPALPLPPDHGASLPPDVGVSIVVATRDRPDDLRACLDSLLAQRTVRPLEVIVVDNNPASELTRDVVGRYPGVVLVAEERAGLSYARNRGIVAASHPIVVTTDDDVVAASDWIENLLQPFARPGVMAVTGNVLPLELETPAQALFERYGGLSRGYAPLIADHSWFSRWRRSVPTWELGCTANAAFRAEVFSLPGVGLMDEALGAGTPTGCSEDTYVFYRLLKAGYSIAYEPRAYVWHRHRRTEAALRHQIYSYSKGHIAYHLLTWFNEGDRRALVRLVLELPTMYVRRIVLRLRRQIDYPLRLIFLEVLGNLAGPWTLWQSRRRVRRLGKSLRPAASRDVVRSS